MEPSTTNRNVTAALASAHQRCYQVLQKVSASCNGKALSINLDLPRHALRLHVRSGGFAAAALSCKRGLGVLL